MHRLATVATTKMSAGMPLRVPNAKTPPHNSPLPMPTVVEVMASLFDEIELVRASLSDE